MGWDPFVVWYQNYSFREIDQKLKHFLKAEKVAEGWLSLARKALFLSRKELAAKLGITSSALKQIEKSELRGAVKIETLERVAEAMQCELVYAIRPKSRKLFSEVVWEHLENAAKEHISRGPEANPNLEIENPLLISGLAKSIMRDPEFRREQGWSKRFNSKGLLEPNYRRRFR